MTELSVKLRKTLNAPVEKVFDAWLDAETLSRFMTPMPGMPEPRVEADGREGGGFVIYMQVGDEEIPHKGKYLEVTPYSKLVFTWESPFSVDGSFVTIYFKKLDNDNTEIDFVHLKFKGEEERSNHEGGWTNILEKLNAVTKSSTLQGATV